MAGGWGGRGAARMSGSCRFAMAGGGQAGRVAADVGVIGAGIVGLATAYALAERGASVAVYERGVPGQGQSGGESRIFRHAHDDARLVALAQPQPGASGTSGAARLGTELVAGDGAVAIGPAVDRRLEVLAEAGRCARTCGIDAEELARAAADPRAFDGPGDARRARRLDPHDRRDRRADRRARRRAGRRRGARRAPHAGRHRRGPRRRRDAPSTTGSSSAPAAAPPRWRARPGWRCRSTTAPTCG